MVLRALLISLCLSFACTAHAADAQAGGVVIAIPPGFSGPLREEINPSTETIGYVAGSAKNRTAELITLTRYSIGEKEPARDASEYLLEMLRGIEQRRTHYRRTPVEKIRLGGIMGARAQWVGKLDGAPTSGAMYCIIVENDVIVLHAFGSGGEENAKRKLSMRAIEALRVPKAKKSLNRETPEWLAPRES
jgi:hypothetical protein